MIKIWGVWATPALGVAPTYPHEDFREKYQMKNFKFDRKILKICKSIF